MDPLGVAAAVTGMLAWVAGVALIPPDAKLGKGNQHLAQVLRAHSAQLYAAALLAILGAVLLAGFFAVLTRLVPGGRPATEPFRTLRRFGEVRTGAGQSLRGVVGVRSGSDAALM